MKYFVKAKLQLSGWKRAFLVGYCIAMLLCGTELLLTWAFKSMRFNMTYALPLPGKPPLPILITESILSRRSLSLLNGPIKGHPEVATHDLAFRDRWKGALWLVQNDLQTSVLALSPMEVSQAIERIVDHLVSDNSRSSEYIFPRWLQRTGKILGSGYLRDVLRSMLRDPALADVFVSGPELRLKGASALTDRDMECIEFESDRRCFLSALFEYHAHQITRSAAGDVAEAKESSNRVTARDLSSAAERRLKQRKDIEARAKEVYWNNDDARPYWPVADGLIFNTRPVKRVPREHAWIVSAVSLWDEYLAETGEEHILSAFSKDRWRAGLAAWLAAFAVVGYLCSRKAFFSTVALIAHFAAATIYFLDYVIINSYAFKYGIHLATRNWYCYYVAGLVGVACLSSVPLIAVRKAQRNFDLALRTSATVSCSFLDEKSAICLDVDDPSAVLYTDEHHQAAAADVKSH